MSDAAKMQESSGPERIRFAASPLDPLAGRFTLERSLTRAPLHFPDAIGDLHGAHAANGEECRGERCVLCGGGVGEV